MIGRSNFNYFGKSNKTPQYDETFYYYNELNDVVTSIEFAYNSKKHPRHQHFFEYENGLLKYVWDFFEETNDSNLYYYATSNQLYRAKYCFNPSTNTLLYSSYITYHYDQNNELSYIESVKEDNKCLVYLRPKETCYVQRVKTWLLKHIQFLIEKNQPQDLIYSFFLYYGTEDIVPPSFYYGYQSDIEDTDLIDTYGYEILWNPADFPEEYELVYPGVFHEPDFIFLYNQETKYAESEQLLCEVAIEIKTWLKQHYSSFLTEDFSVVVTHYELHTLEKFFKIINPEIYEKIKYQFEGI